MEKIVIDIPLQASMPEAVEIFKKNLPGLNLIVKEIESDSPTIKLSIAKEVSVVGDSKAE